MVHIGSIPGAIFAFIMCEHVGILWTMRQLCVMWAAGVIIVITAAGSIGQVYASRFIMGLGIGQAGVVVPIYLSEVATPTLRGLMVGTFATSEYMGIMIGVSIHLPPATETTVTNVITLVFLKLGNDHAHLQQQLKAMDNPTVCPDNGCWHSSAFIIFL